MVGDRPRTDAFAAAIASVVQDDDVVLDVGTGTGVLAMLAARAGARRVYAIDQSDVAKTAVNLVKANGLSDRIKVLKGPAAELRLDEKVDVLISEWLGNMAFVEGMLADVVMARDTNLAQGGRMVPSRIRVFVAPIDDGLMYQSEGPGLWKEPCHGLDFSTLEQAELDQGRAVQMRIEPAVLLADPIQVAEIDLATCSKDWPTVGTATVACKRDGMLNGFVGWFEAQLTEDICLDTSPLAAETHWAQTYLPWQPTHVRADAPLGVGYALQPDPDEPRFVHLSLTVFGRTVRFAVE